MKKLKISVTVTAILCFLSLIALILMYLALSDISKEQDNSMLEWKIVQFSWITIVLFVISAFFYHRIHPENSRPLEE